MAFHDILRALTTEADGRIAAAKVAAEAALEETRATLDADAAATVVAIDEAHQKEKRDLEVQAAARTYMSEQRAMQQAKHNAMERAYKNALETLTKLDAAKTEALLRTLIDSCPAEGTLRPTEPHATLVKKLAGKRDVGATVPGRGGFVCESPATDRDCRYEALVRDILRPATELAVAGTLFPSQR